MKNFFNDHLAEEFLESEKLRVSILLGAFSVGLIYAAVNFYSILKNAPEELIQSMMTTALLLGVMVIFEFSLLLYVRKKIKKDYESIPSWVQYLTAFIEISFPTAIMIFLAVNISSPVFVLNSPIAYVYFIFIILSTLKLDYKISLFISLAGAFEFFLLCLALTDSNGPLSLDQFQHSYLIFTAKSILILLSGFSSAFIAKQIKTKIDRSLSVAENGNRIVNLFGQQISKEIVDEMLKSSGSIPSKLLRVCVMFIDIRNFTSYVTGKTPEEIVKYQNDFFSIVIETVIKNGGIINQFLGDGCMITFGAPVSIASPCQCAVMTAFEIKNNLEHFAKQNRIAPTSVGIGIHVGEAVTGNIGTELRQQYSITGSVVILAARIEQLNKEYKSQILISTEVFEELEKLPLETEHLGFVNLKGWNKPVGIYKLA